MPDPGLNYSFEVTIDGVTGLGTWTECSGLTAEYDVKTFHEGGENAFEHKLPGHLKFTNVTLKRPVDSDSRKVAAWFSSMQGVVRRSTAQITVFDGDRGKVADWTLTGVVPVKWTGPSFNASSGDAAQETLELAHHGFTSGIG